MSGVVLAPASGRRPRLPGWTALLRLAPVLLPPVLLAAVILAVWEAGTRALDVSAAVLVPPSAVAAVLVAHAGLLAQHTAVTAAEMLEGFGLAAAIGVAVAAPIAASRVVRDVLMPYLLVLQIVPKIALAPLFIVWLGTGTPCRLVFAVFLGLFPVTISAAAGLLSADAGALRLARSLRAGRVQEIVLIRLPYALPHLFAGLKVAVTMVLLGVIIGEFVTAQAGLGYLILFASSIGDTALVLAAILLLCAIGLVLYAGVVLAERAYGRWFGAPPPDLIIG